MRNEGLKGNEISARLGNDWRKMSAEEKLSYKRKAYFKDKLKERVILGKSQSVIYCRKKATTIKKFASLRN